MRSQPALPGLNCPAPPALADARDCGDSEAVAGLQVCAIEADSRGAHPIKMATTEQTPVRPMAAPRAGVRISGFILTVQAILLAVHWTLSETWAFFVPPETAREAALLRLATVLLALSFVGASLLAW